MKKIAVLSFAMAATSMAQIKPSTLPKTGEVSPRFQSYNVEMVEIIGGRFWKPYGSAAKTAAPAASGRLRVGSIRRCLSSGSRSI